MLPSLHDDFLISYEVNGETRQIKLCARPDARSAGNEQRTPRTIVFSGVEGCQFENDALGSIIYHWTQLLLSSCSPGMVHGGCPTRARCELAAEQAGRRGASRALPPLKPE
jgi:hypothetical protein